MEPITITPEQRREILFQIGKTNVFAISGGRITPIPSGVDLPVSHGYNVRIELLADDTYRVSRIMKRAGKVTDKGSVDGVFCDEVGELAYYASCYRNDSGYWAYHNPAAKEAS